MTTQADRIASHNAGRHKGTPDRLCSLCWSSDDSNVRTAAPPPREWHPATCHHKWCNCYDPASHDKDGDCRWCRRDKRVILGADLPARHPEGFE